MSKILLQFEGKTILRMEGIYGYKNEVLTGMVIYFTDGTKFDVCVVDGSLSIWDY